MCDLFFFKSREILIIDVELTLTLFSISTASGLTSILRVEAGLTAVIAQYHVASHCPRTRGSHLDSVENFRINENAPNDLRQLKAYQPFKIAVLVA